MWCLMKSFIVIKVLQRFMQKKTSRTSPWRKLESCPEKQPVEILQQEELPKE